MILVVVKEKTHRRLREQLTMCSVYGYESIIFEQDYSITSTEKIKG